MSIIVNEGVRLLVQGITGHQGRYHTRAMKEYGTNVVAGVTPGKGGDVIENVPVFDTVEETMDLEPNTSVVFVPAPFVRDAVFESLDAGIRTIVVITERTPIHDAMEIIHYTKYRNATIIGPNGPGIISPTRSVKIGIMPSKIFRPGRVGVVSRSGTLTYEIVNTISEAGMGQSTCIGLGGDAIVGLSFLDVLKLFEKDEETDIVVMVGEIGGTAEEDTAEYIKKMKKKVCAYIAGITAPEGKRMGHAGAIINRGKGTAKSKIEALTNAGASVVRRPVDIPAILRG